MANLPGTRVRDNGVYGTITDNPLTAGAVSFNSVDLADLSTVSGNHALVTLDPLREHGDPEIVMVTAHTASATVATIQRGMFGTVARQHPITTLWLHAATNDDFIRIVTSGTQPTDVYRGQLIFETDTDKYVRRATDDTWKDLLPSRGVLGSVYKTSGTHTTTTSQADVTGLSLAVTTVASRRYRVSAKVRAAVWTSASWPEPGKITVWLMDGANELSRITWHTNHLYLSENTDIFLDWTGVPGAASKTYKIQASYNDGSQPAEITGEVNRVSYVIVEDIGV